MKKNVTYIDQSEFEAIEKSLGVATKENAGFRQIALGNDYHSYVARTKTVGRVDYQFLPPEGLKGVRVLGDGERFGRIVAQLDFGPEKRSEILEAHMKMLEHGKALPKYERPKKQAIGSTKPLSGDSSPKDRPLIVSPEEALKEEAVAQAKRKALIEQVAKQKGVTISPKANIL